MTNSLPRQRSVLITGGLGFIGSTLIEHFLPQGYQITVVDNCSSNVVFPEWVASHYPEIDLHCCDLLDFLDKLDPRICFDTVVHAASFVGSIGVLRHAGNMANKMLAMTQAVAELCQRGRSRLFFISSSEVYGRNGVLSENEDIRVPAYANARLEYALAKLTSEAVLANLANKGLSVVVVRPFNVVGPRQSRQGGFVLPTFVQQALGNGDITVYYDGTQQRSFLDVNDLATFFMCSLQKPATCGYQCFNLGNPDNMVSILKLAKRVKRLCRSASRIIHVDPVHIHGKDYCEAESKQKLCRIDRALASGWNPIRQLDDIIRDVMTYYVNHLDPDGANARHLRKSDLSCAQTAP